MGELRLSTVLQPRGPAAAVVLTDEQVALAGVPGARQAFDVLAYSHREEHVRSVADDKRPETRARHLDQVLATVRRLHDGEEPHAHSCPPKAGRCGDQLLRTSEDQVAGGDQ